MSPKNKVIAAVVSLLVAFAAGRHSVPVSVKTEVKTAETEKKASDTKTVTDRDRHKKTDIITVERPDGTKETHTVITDDTDTTRKTDSKSNTEIAKASDSKSETVRSSGHLNLSVLAGGKISFSSSPIMPVYGACVSRNLVGPITIGLFGLSDGVGGVAVGLDF